jgi:hypothetical protein
MVTTSPMFQCPLCRQVANLTASVSTESLVEPNDDKIDPDGPINPDHKTESPNSTDISHAPNPDNNGAENFQDESLNENLLAAETEKRRQSSSASDSNSKKPSLSMKLTELLARSHATNSNYIDSANRNNETTNIQPSVSVRLTPRSETSHFIRPSADHGRNDSEESIS